MAVGIARNAGTDAVATNHVCAGVTTTLTGSSNVRLNGKGFVRLGDINTPHAAPPFPLCPSHSVSMSTNTVPNVRVNGLPIAKLGSAYGTEVIISASSNVRTNS